MSDDFDPFVLFPIGEDPAPAPVPAQQPEPPPAAPPPREGQYAVQPPTPYTIRTIMEQCGGRGLNGAFTYVGAHDFAFKCQGDPDESVRSGYFSKVTDNGTIDYDVGLRFSVNGKRGRNWTMVIVYEPNDEYTVYLWQRCLMKDRVAGKVGEVLEVAEDVYDDNLKEVVEHMYDRNIKKHCDGFIPC